MREYILREILVLGVVVCFIGASVSVVATGGVNDFKRGMDHWFISKYHSFRLSDASHRLYTHRLSYSMDTSILDAPVEEWNKTFGGKEDDYGFMIKQSDDGYIIAGTTLSYGAGDHDVWLIKIDSNGNMVWNKTFGGPYDDRAYSVIKTTDGGYLLAGLFSPSKDTWAGWIIKTDARGNMIWNKTYDSYGEFFSIEQTNDGSYILTGGIDNPYLPSIWVLKIDENGSEIWNKRFNEGVLSLGWSIRQTSDGDYIISGSSLDSRFISDLLLLKIDSTGEKEWCKLFGRKDFYEEGGNIQETSDGGYIVVGYVDDGKDILDVWLIKTDNDGNMIWNKTYGGSGGEKAFSVDTTIDSGYIIAGVTNSYGAGNSDIWLIKTDGNGNEEWNETFGGKGEDGVWYAEQTSDSSYIIAGYTDSYGSGGFNVWVIKLAPEDYPPLKPTISGPSKGKVGKTYTYTAMTSDPDGDKIYYMFDWGDGNISEWLGPYNSGETVNVSYSWSNKGNYEIRVKAKDTYGMESEWSDPLPVSMPRERLMDIVFQKLSHFFPHFFSIYWN